MGGGMGAGGEGGGLAVGVSEENREGHRRKAEYAADLKVSHAQNLF